MAAMNGLTATPELRKLLDQAQKDYQDNLTNLTDAATDEIETAITRGDIDLKALVSQYSRDASQLSNDYYDTLRGLWSEYGDTSMPDFDHTRLIDPERVLWQQQGGFSNTDYNGLTYKQVMEGRSRAGATIDDLWPDMTNVDNAQQFIADMINTSGRLTMQRNIRTDPTHPRWARVCGGLKPCAFCVMLASRGFAYTSEDTADFGGSFHNGNCHCTVVPSWGKNKILLAKQAEWDTMYHTALKQAGSNDPNKLTHALNHLYPDQLSSGIFTLSKPWPDTVIQPRSPVWEHVFGNHGPNATVLGKTHFPASWDEKKIKWAVEETVVNPDCVIAGGSNRSYLYKMVDDELIRVWLQKTRATKGRFAIHTSHPVTAQERERIWQRIKNTKPPTGD